MHLPRQNVLRRWLALFWIVASTGCIAESNCFGSVNNGRLENGVKLPTSGSNFATYSALGSTAGRTFVHSTVRDIMLDAYKALAVAHPELKFVYGETGWESGGRIRPHRTHQNGLSVDFFVPVRDAAGHSVHLPTGITNKFGYDIDFDSAGQFQALKIDFTAIAEHLYQLDISAKSHGGSLALVIFDPPYLQKLLATRRGSYLQKNIPFMKGSAWVRHDEHYHVDFKIACKKL
jgi:penicillin-insensitive murein DD-endopeptidase